MSIALISCSKAKHKGIHRAYKLYSKSDLFNKYVKYAQKNCTNFYILSAKYGLIDKNKLLQDYDYTLVGKTDKILREFGERVSNEIKQEINADEEIIVLAGENYIKYLNIPNKITNPFKGMSIGYRLQKLKNS